MTEVEVIKMGLEAPSTVGELIWYGFGLLGTYFLWSINDRLRSMNEKLDESEKSREALALRVASIEATCAERHKHNAH